MHRPGACLIPLLLAIVVPPAALTQSKTAQNVALDREFNLAGAHLNATQYYVMETRVTMLAFNGSRTPEFTLRLALKCAPGSHPGGAGDTYTCARFSVQRPNRPPMVLEALTNWTYVFKGPEADTKGPVLGIEHSKFQTLRDSAGKALPAGMTYMVYNSFIDFHAMCSVFAEATSSGKGIQDLKRIGQKIVHVAAFSQPPTNLGDQVLEGSYFKNGEITLEFKGIGVQNNSPCAIIGYDSGESSFKMIMVSMPDVKTETNGSSHYWGDIYKSMATGWVQQVDMTEVVFSETSLPFPPGKVNAMTERALLIRNVSEQEFESELK